MKNKEKTLLILGLIVSIILVVFGIALLCQGFYYDWLNDTQQIEQFGYINTRIWVLGKEKMVAETIYLVCGFIDVCLNVPMIGTYSRRLVKLKKEKSTEVEITVAESETKEEPSDKE